MESEHEQRQPLETVTTLGDTVEAGATPEEGGTETWAWLRTWGWLPMSEEHRWGEPITPAWQAELDGYLQRWDAEERTRASHGERAGPFARATTAEKGLRLTGADVYYLAKPGRAADGSVPNLHLETLRHMESFG